MHTPLFWTGWITNPIPQFTTHPHDTRYHYRTYRFFVTFGCTARGCRRLKRHVLLTLRTLVWFGSTPVATPRLRIPVCRWFTQPAPIYPTHACRSFDYDCTVHAVACRSTAHAHYVFFWLYTFWTLLPRLRTRSVAPLRLALLGSGLVRLPLFLHYIVLTPRPTAPPHHFTRSFCVCRVCVPVGWFYVWLYHIVTHRTPFTQFPTPVTPVVVRFTPLPFRLFTCVAVVMPGWFLVGLRGYSLPARFLRAVAALVAFWLLRSTLYRRLYDRVTPRTYTTPFATPHCGLRYAFVG